MTAVALGGYAFGIEPRWITVERHRLPVRNLPLSLEGATAVHLTDLHVGSRVSDAYLLNQFEYVKSLEPEFVFFTGDFLDDATDWHLQKGLKLLKEFPKGRIGNASVLGNHDYGNGHQKTAANEACTKTLIDAFDHAGMNVLFDNFVELDGLKVGGLNDLWFGSFNMITAREVICEVADGASIILSHNPDSVDFPIWDSYRSWVLCGHTHGGQCNFPIVGAPITPVENKRYVSGFYDIEGGHNLYISRGVGHTHRVRFGARPEITVFTLACETA